MSTTRHNPAHANTAPAHPPGAPALVSKLAGDPDMVELIQMFVEEIPERVRLVQDYWERRDLDELRRIAHQLKGACGGYGFPEVGQVAGVLEHGLLAKPSRPDSADLEAIGKHVRDLIDMCQRVRAA